MLVRVVCEIEATPAIGQTLSMAALPHAVVTALSNAIYAGGDRHLVDLILVRAEAAPTDRLNGKSRGGNRRCGGNRRGAGRPRQVMTPAMTEALAAVEGGMSVAEASKKFGVHKAAIYYHRSKAKRAAKTAGSEVASGAA